MYLEHSLHRLHNNGHFVTNGFITSILTCSKIYTSLRKWSNIQQLEGATDHGGLSKLSKLTAVMSIRLETNLAVNKGYTEYIVSLENISKLYI